jgi:hypothetical protein
MSLVVPSRPPDVARHSLLHLLVGEERNHRKRLNSTGAVRRIAFFSDHCLHVSNLRRCPYFLEGLLHLPPPDEPRDDPLGIDIEIGTERRAWVSNSSRGSRISAERKGTAGSPRAVPDRCCCRATSTLRFSLPHQSVAGSSAATERFGRHSPFKRGLPLARLSERSRPVGGGIQAQAGYEKAIGFSLSLRQRSSSFKEACPATATISHSGCQSAWPKPATARRTR